MNKLLSNYYKVNDSVIGLCSSECNIFCIFKYKMHLIRYLTDYEIEYRY